MIGTCGSRVCRHSGGLVRRVGGDHGFEGGRDCRGLGLVD